MSAQTTILVAGGTGTLGTRVVKLLLESDNTNVRVLTRNPDRARHLFSLYGPQPQFSPERLELVAGDIRSASDVAAAVEGCSRVVSLVHGFAGTGKPTPSPAAIDRDGNRLLIDAAAAASVDHLTLLSVCGASIDHPMSLHRAKFEAEETLRAQSKSGLAFTIIRATAFLETWVSVIGGSPDGRSLQRPIGRPLVFGPGTNPINFISVNDVAAVVVLCARDGALRNEVVEIGGPENLNFVTFAEQLCQHKPSEPSKPSKPIKRIPLTALRVMSVLARPFNPVFARQAAAAVVMNTIDMTLKDNALSSLRVRYPQIPNTTLSDVLQQIDNSPDALDERRGLAASPL